MKSKYEKFCDVYTKAEIKITPLIMVLAGAFLVILLFSAYFEQQAKIQETEKTKLKIIFSSLERGGTVGLTSTGKIMIVCEKVSWYHMNRGFIYKKNIEE